MTLKPPLTHSAITVTKSQRGDVSMTTKLNDTIRQLIEHPQTLRDRRRHMIKRFGRFTSVTLYDPQHRDRAFIEQLLESYGFRVQIEDEQDDEFGPSAK
jgi:hypothetical protein